MNVVFAIGCKRYRDPRVAQLQYADQDAKRFVETLMGTQDPDNTRKYLLHDGHENEDFRPTRANILYFLSEGEDLYSGTELDFLFFYFSGHGWSSQDGTDYLLTTDSLVRMPDETAISVPMLEGHLRNWEAKHVVLFIDACRTVMTGGKGSITIAEESRIDVDSLCPPGMVTFCSCEPGKTSYEADPIHSGVFTEGICRALSDKGQCSTIEELNRYLNEKVPKISDTYGLPRQIPYSRVQPLGVERATIVSQHIREAWQIQEHGDIKQIPPETITQEEPRGKYRQAVEWTWTDEDLNERDVRRLSNFANRLGLSQSAASAIEVDVIGETKEGSLERRERERAAEDQAKKRYREAVEEAWTDTIVDDAEAKRLRTLAGELGLSTDTTAGIERQVAGDTIQDILQHQARERRAREVRERQQHLNELYDRARHLHREQKWQAVIYTLEEIYSQDPDYHDREGLLRSAREALDLQQRVSEIYDQGLRYADTENWRQAAHCFEEVLRLEPGYRDTERLLSQVRQEMGDYRVIQQGKVTGHGHNDTRSKLGRPAAGDANFLAAKYVEEYIRPSITDLSLSFNQGISWRS